MKGNDTRAAEKEFVKDEYVVGRWIQALSLPSGNKT